MEVTGGNENAKYYANFGMQYNSSFKYGDHKMTNNLAFNVRGNIDVCITSWLSAFANVGININNPIFIQIVAISQGRSSLFRPNWYTALIPIDMIDTNNSSLKTIVGNSNNIIDASNC